MATDFYYRAMALRRGGNVPWWGRNAPQASDKMSYDCDANLGAPHAADCSQLDFSQLGPPSDTVNIGPGASKVLTLKECGVAVSAEVPVIVTWAQIRAALDTLIDICVSNPLKSSLGGKAYYVSQVAPNLHGRKYRRVDSVSGKSTEFLYILSTQEYRQHYRSTDSQLSCRTECSTATCEHHYISIWSL